MEEQIAAEVEALLRLVQRVYGDFGLKPEVKLSTRPAEFLGEVATWDHAESVLEAARWMRSARPTRSTRGTGRSTVRRSTSTSPTPSGGSGSARPSSSTTRCRERFELKYVGADNAEHRPVVIHRAIFGSFERFIALLIEHYAGGVPAVAGAGAGGRSCRLRTAIWTTRGRCAARWRRGAAGRDRRAAGEDWI